jgi:hypothetical protein
MLLSGCGRKTDDAGIDDPKTDESSSGTGNTGTIVEDTDPVEKGLALYINGSRVEVDWENNEAVAALKEKVAEGAIEIDMSMYGGFEQVGPFGFSLPRNDTRITTGPGDIVLYSGDQIVVFYGSNTWSYTKLGHITDRDQTDLKELLGNGNVVLTISLAFEE